MAFNKGDRSDSPMRRKGGMRRRKKVCVFCGKDHEISYKDAATLRKYIPETHYGQLCEAPERTYKRDQESKTSCDHALCN